jgi:putative toxin-antitoxin system antitoxin component (TIGR02293 family)
MRRIIQEAFMGKLHEKIDLPSGHYYLHVAVLAGLPVSLISDLASELERSPEQIAEWVTASPDSALMSMQAGEVFCRLIEILDALLELHEGDLGGTLRWLTAPNAALSNERPIDLLVTESGTRAVRQAMRAIEYGLPV